MLGDKSSYTASLTILLEHLKSHPSVLNSKVIQCDVTAMMFLEDDLSPAIKILFLTIKEESVPRLELIIKMTNS